MLDLSWWPLTKLWLSVNFIMERNSSLLIKVRGREIYWLHRFKSCLKCSIAFWLFAYILNNNTTTLHSYGARLFVVAWPYGQCSFGNRSMLQITMNNMFWLSRTGAMTALKRNYSFLFLSVGSHAVLFLPNLIYLQYFSFNNWCINHGSFFSQGGTTASYLILLFSH